jgi:hypothetical protein
MQKLTAQPHARAGSMEVDGYENPEAENQGFTSRGGSRTHALFRFTTRAAAGLPPIPLSQTRVLCSLGGGGDSVGWGAGYIPWELAATARYWGESSDRIWRTGWPVTDLADEMDRDGSPN